MTVVGLQRRKKNVMKFRLFFQIQKSGAIQVMNEIKVLGSKDRYGNNNKITTNYKKEIYEPRN